jgi:hypothetical protein
MKNAPALALGHSEGLGELPFWVQNDDQIELRFLPVATTNFGQHSSICCSISIC